MCAGIVTQCHHYFQQTLVQIPSTDKRQEIAMILDLTFPVWELVQNCHQFFMFVMGGKRERETERVRERQRGEKETGWQRERRKGKH